MSDEETADNRQVITVSASSLDRMQLCFRLYKFMSIDGWGPKVKGRRIEMGSYLHELLFAYYSAKIAGGQPDIAKIVFEGHAKFAATTFLEGSDLVTVERLVQEYAVLYASEDWHPLFAEQPFTKVLYEDEDYIFAIQGKIDLGVRTPYKELMIVDHKLVGQNKESPYLSNQNMCYSWAFETSNVMINRVGDQKSYAPKDRMTRQLRSYPKDIIDEWIEYTIYWVKQLLFMIKHDFYPPNYTSCDKMSGCFMRDVCKQPFKSREWKLDQMFEKREKHNLYEAEAE